MKTYTKKQVKKVQATINMLVHTAEKTDEIHDFFDEDSREHEKFCENIANNIGFAIVVLLPIAQQDDKEWKPEPCENDKIQRIVDHATEFSHVLNTLTSIMD